MSSVGALDGYSFLIQWQGVKPYETATWLRMMADSFKQADKDRADIAQNGTWMNDTVSLQRWAVVDFYI